MPGLMPEPRPEPQQAPQERPTADEGANVSPEEQGQYDEFVSNAIKLIYSEKALPGVLRTLQGDGQPQEGLANAAVSVVSRLHDSAKQNGAELSPDVMMHGGLEIVEDLANLQKESGIADLSTEEIEGAFYRALDIYRESMMASGELDTQAFKQDFAAMAEADQQGRLGEMVPGADQAAQRLAQAAPQQAEA